MTLGGVLSALLGGACTGPSPGAPPLTPDHGRLAPELVWSFETLQRAVEADDDALAWRILSALQSRGLSGKAEELARAYERILIGRELLDGVSLRLVLEALPSSPAEDTGYAVVLVARNLGAADLVLDLPPATLKRTSVALDAACSQSRRVETSTVDPFENLLLPAGESVRQVLAEALLGELLILGLRDAWSLETRSGEVRRGAEGFPAAAPPVARAVREELAGFLPLGAVEPATFVEYARRPEVDRAALAERAVRIEPGQREEALELLAPHLEGMTDERFLLLLPAMGWLAEAPVAGTTQRQWVSWLRGADERRSGRPALDLPDPEDEESP